MTFVPFVPPPAPSTRAYELGKRLKELIESFRRENPDTTTTDIWQAVDLAKSGFDGTSRNLVIALVAGLVILGLLAFYFFVRP